LPLEIRRNVYKCVTKELWEEILMNDNRVRFYATERAWCDKRPHENAAYDVTITSDQPDYASSEDGPAGDLDYTFEDRMSTSDEASETTSVLSSDDSDVDMDDLPPPMPQVHIVVNRDFTNEHRGYCYHNTCIDPSKICRPHPPFYCPCLFKPPAAFLDIINLSQVSPQITRELGECLWENATVRFDDPGTFLMFARERPATLPFIRGIVLGLDCSAQSPDLNTDTDELAAMLGFVSEQLDLRFFDVELRTSFRLALHVHPQSMAIPDAAPPPQDPIGPAAIAWAPLFRALRTDAFDVEVLDFGPETATLLRKRPAPLAQQRIESARAAVLELWKPDCVREREGGEEARYLRSRDACG
jgi:hypothetical protein